MQVFNLADYASRGQGMAMNKMKMDEYQRAQQKEETLSVLASQHVKEDGSVDLEGLANALPAAGFVQEGLEMQMQARKQKQAEADSEFKQAQQMGEAYTNMWETLKPAAMDLLKNGDETSLNNLNVLIGKVAPELEYQLPNDINAAKTEVKLMMPMLEAEGDLYKLTTQAAEARAVYGEDSEEFKAASKQLIDKQDELSVEKKKLDYELEKSRLDIQKTQREAGNADLDKRKKELEIQKSEQDIKDSTKTKAASKNIQVGDNVVAGRELEDGTLQVKDNGKWVNAPDDAKIATTEKSVTIASPTKGENETVNRLLDNDPELGELKGDGLFNAKGNYNEYRDAVSSRAKEIMKKNDTGFYEAARMANDELKSKIVDGEFKPDHDEWAGLQSATNPQTGEKLYLKDGKWQPKPQ